MEVFRKYPAIEETNKIVTSNPHPAGSEGFSLVESLMAILILTLGFILVGPMMMNAINSLTLARSKDTSGLAAANKLETLALQYQADADDPDLTTGTHGPEEVEIVNPIHHNIVNRFSVSWTVGQVTDLSGKELQAVQVAVQITPIGSTGSGTNIQVGQNKVTHLSTIFSHKNIQITPIGSTGSGTTI